MCLSLTREWSSPLEDHLTVAISKQPRSLVIVVVSKSWVGVARQLAVVS